MWDVDFLTGSGQKLLPATSGPTQVPAQWPYYKVQGQQEKVPLADNKWAFCNIPNYRRDCPIIVAI